MSHHGKRLPSVLTRRSLLRRAAYGAAAACCSPLVLPSSVFGAFAPSNRLNIGMIGLGNQGHGNLSAFLDQPDTQVVAVCDVNTASHGYASPKQFLGRKPGQDAVNAYYAKKNNVGQYKGCDAYIDFREVIDRSDINAVVLVVPDHWHAIMTVMAAKAGKDIYCEKPLSLTVRQGQQMVKAVRQYQRVLQTGSMERSNPPAAKACELVRNGYIGKVTRAIIELPGNNAKSPGPGWKPMPVPEGFDYEMWLGPAPAAPYHIDRCLYRFRFILDYSGGQMTNFGAHRNGLVQWALGADNTGPVEFEDMGAEWPVPGDLFTTATKTAFRARYENGVELIGRSGHSGLSVRFEGTEGWIEYGKGLRTSPESLASVQFGPDAIHLAHGSYTWPPSEKKGGRDSSLSHVRDFLDCIKTRQDPVEPVEAGHRTASICHLGNIAMKLRRKIRWDPKREEIIGDDEAATMLDRPMRGPWKLDV